jgi:hypothetical protein
MGGDEIVGLAAHNNFLFIFGRKQILIYQGASAPGSMTLQDTIVGIGCIARDTIQGTGEDVFFLSDSGVRSLQRTIQEKSAPFRNISKNVHDYIQSVVGLNDLSAIKAAYSATNDFYLMTLPTSAITLCFDTRAILPDGSARTTQWSNINPKAFCETKGRKLYIGKAGYVGEHSGYLDDTATYRIRYYTTWIDFGNQIQTSILKKILLTVIGGATQTIIFQWAFDFSSIYRSETSQITGTLLTGEWGTTEWGTTYEWGGGAGVSEVGVNAGGVGKLLQFGFETDISDVSLSVQKIDIFTKDGKL